MFDASSKLNVCPAGTVNDCILTVVHFCAAETSLRDAIDAVHGLDERGWFGKADEDEEATSARRIAVRSFVEIMFEC